ncbi:MAG: hypothetical protein ACOYEL_05590 [Saccharofermentanales bacterium]
MSKEYGIDASNIKYYVNLFQKHGPIIFTNPEEQRSYSRERVNKKNVARLMQKY